MSMLQYFGSTSLSYFTPLAMTPCYRDCNFLHKFRPATSPPVQLHQAMRNARRSCHPLLCSLFQAPVITYRCDIMYIHCFVGIVVLVGLLSYTDDLLSYTDDCLLRIAPSGYGLLLDPCLPSVLVTV